MITNQELIAIQVTWNRDGFFDKHVGEIYRDVYKKDLSTNNMKSLGQTEKRILKDVCKDKPEFYHLIDNLIDLQESKTLLISKYGFLTVSILFILLPLPAIKVNIGISIKFFLNNKGTFLAKKINSSRSSGVPHCMK